MYSATNVKQTIGPSAMLAANIDKEVQQAQNRLLARLEPLLDDTGAMLRLIGPEVLASRGDNYTRHLIHADEMGRYSVMLLVWHPGHHTPVHAHKTWCVYKVLQGTLSEHQYTFDSRTGRVRSSAWATRQTGYVSSASAGLSTIHRLSNDTNSVAVSLHIYGVDGERIATHVNLLMHES